MYSRMLVGKLTCLTLEDNIDSKGPLLKCPTWYLIKTSHFIAFAHHLTHEYVLPLAC